MTIDVVVVTWRKRAMLERCLRLLGDQDVAHCTWVVDNGSDDGTVELVRESFPRVRLLALESNLGFGRAVNRGVEAGHGEAIVLINDDVEVEPGFLEAMIAPLFDDRVGMVAGMTLLPGSGLVDGFGIELDPTLAAYNRLRRRPPDATRGRLAGPSGGAAAYRRVAWETVDGFDERFFAYGEDVDLALRLRAQGWLAAEAPQARGTHLGGATAGVDSPLQRELAGFARGFLLRRYGVLRSRASLRALVFEALVVGWGLARFRTTIPLRARVRGWRAAAGDPVLPVPQDALEYRIGWREALCRLRRER